LTIDGALTIERGREREKKEIGEEDRRRRKLPGLKATKLPRN
jgi:hypothetical protein